MGITPAMCGNQSIEEGESCDDGDLNGQPTYCDTSCMGITPAMCGNQAIEEGESCDDGELNGQEGYCNTECSDQTFLPDNEPATINSVGITPDNYACNLESQEENPNSEITISADVTDNDVIAWVKADISQIIPPSELTVADYATNLVELTYNENTGRYEYTFTVPETSQYNFDPKLITVTADDNAGNSYQAEEGVNSASVILYSMTYPQVDSECEEYGETTSSTNFCNIADWRNVNLIQEVKKYGEPLECNNQEDMPWGEEFRSIFRLEFESLDLADEDVLQKLQKLGEAIKVSIVPPGQAGASYINVDSTYFAELSSPALVSFYGLPMTDEPEIIGPEDRDEAEVDDFVQNEPFAIALECFDFEGAECDEGNEDCECEYTYVPNSDITFYVDGFSQYDLVDNEDPTVVFPDYESGQYTNTGSLDLDIEIDGTGTQLSQVQLLVDGELLTEYDYTQIFSECTDIEGDYNYEWIDCPFSLELAEGEHTITVVATDLGVEEGNTQQEELVLVVDTTSPEGSILSPDSDVLITGTVQLKAEGSDTNGISKVEFYYHTVVAVDRIDEEDILIGEASVDEEGEYVLEWDTSELADGDYSIVAKIYDPAENAVSYTESVTLDNSGPEVSFSSPASEDYFSNSVTLEVDASDEFSMVKSVTFYRQTSFITSVLGLTEREEWELLGEDASEPYTYSCDTSEESEGAVQVKAVAEDELGNTAETDSLTLNIDHTAPETTLSFEEDFDSESWTSKDISISLGGRDSSGFKETLYCIDTDNECTPETVYESPESKSSITSLLIMGLSISEENSYLRYYSTDNAGNVEEVNSQHLLIDKTAPKEKYVLVAPTEVTSEENVRMATKVDDALSGFGRLSAVLLNVITLREVEGTNLEIETVSEEDNIYAVTIDPSTYELAADEYTVRFTATDSVGNVHTYDKNFTVVETSSQDDFLDEDLSLDENETTSVNAEDVDTTIDINASSDLTSSLAIIGSSENSNANPSAT